MNTALALFATLLLAPQAAVAAGGETTDSMLDEAWRLWREGKPVAAIRVAESVSTLPGTTPLQRCNAVSLRAFHELNEGRSCNSARLLVGSEDDCEAAPAWLVKPRQDARSRADCEGTETGRPVSDPGSTESLRAHARLCEQSGADSCLVMRNGKILSEWYGSRYAAPAMMMSSTKSVTALLVGMLIDDGKIASVDDPVCRYVESWCEGSRGKVTVAHLLSHTSGLVRRYGEDESVGYRGDKNEFVLALSPERTPGARFDYSNEGVQLLSPLLDAAAEEPIQDYARRRLFDPLGMKDSALRLDSAGHAWTYADMSATPRDFARLGQLVLAGGEWRGRRIVSTEWIERMLRPSQRLEPTCGYLWWLEQAPRVWMTRGYLDTNMYVFPDSGLIVVRTQSRPIAEAVSYEPAAFELFEAIVAEGG